MSQLAEFLGISNPALSNIKKRGGFPADWAVQIETKYGLLTRWLLTGEGPRRIDETAAGDTAARPATDLPDCIRDLGRWAREVDPNSASWLETQLEDLFPAFKRWREQKNGGSK